MRKLDSRIGDENTEMHLHIIHSMPSDSDALIYLTTTNVPSVWIPNYPLCRPGPIAFTQPNIYLCDILVGIPIGLGLIHYKLSQFMY